MSPNKTIILVLALLVTSVTARSQETAEWKSHRHSLEISTGFPYPMMIHSDVGPEPGSPEDLEKQRMWNEGQSKKETMYPNLTVMYSFRFAEAGEVSVFCNVHGYTYAIRQHAKGYTPGMEWNYDVHKVTKVLERGYVNMAVVPGVQILLIQQGFLEMVFRLWRGLFRLWRGYPFCPQDKSRSHFGGHPFWPQPLLRRGRIRPGPHRPGPAAGAWV